MAYGAGVVKFVRINRFFTDRGICSRREADRYILEGRVRINQRIAVLGDKLEDSDCVELDGQIVSDVHHERVILAYNKPIGVECTSDPEKKNNIIKAVNYSQRIFHIGRLDKNSEGLILLTNRGEIVNPILREENNHEKEYWVEVAKDLSEAMLTQMRNGVDIKDGRGPTKKCRVQKIDSRYFRIVLTEGRFHQIRRMVDAVGNQVKKLRRERIMFLSLGDLKKGEYRLLDRAEQNRLLSELSLGLSMDESGSEHSVL